MVDPLKNDNIVNFKLIKCRDNKKDIKLRKDGKPKQSGGNKKSGVSCEVQPIRDQLDLHRCRAYFMDKIKLSTHKFDKFQSIRNYVIFIVGINTSLRICDILKLKWGDILDENDEFYKSFKPREQKTGKFNLKFIKGDMINAFELYYDVFVECMNEYGKLDREMCIFTSRESNKSAMTEQNVINIIKKMGKDLNLDYNVGTHTMRKTFCYHYLMNNRGDSRALTTLMARLNHATPQQTLTYAGISADEFEAMDEEMSNFYQNIDRGIFTNTEVTQMSRKQMFEFAKKILIVSNSGKEMTDDAINSIIDLYFK